MEKNDKEFIKRQAKDGASELTKDTHVDMNDDFTQGANRAHGMRSDSDDATSASVADNEVEKFAREARDKKDKEANK